MLWFIARSLQASCLEFVVPNVAVLPLSACVLAVPKVGSLKNVPSHTNTQFAPPELVEATIKKGEGFALL